MLDIVRADVDLVQLVHEVHCIIEAMIGHSGEVRASLSLFRSQLSCSVSIGPVGL